jgi:hypothetical protein
MPIAIDYAQPLRAIGQALEVLKMESFELEPDGDDFVVRGKVTASDTGLGPQTSESRNLRFNRETERSSHVSEVEAVRTPAIVNQLDLCYTLKDVDRLEQQGQARRGEPPGITKAPGLSHMLRAIGAYLDEKPARLVRIAKDGESVTIIYETLSSGIKIEEKLDGAALREWEAQMYIKRGRNLH